MKTCMIMATMSVVLATSLGAQEPDPETSAVYHVPFFEEEVYYYLETAPRDIGDPYTLQIKDVGAASVGASYATDFLALGDVRLVGRGRVLLVGRDSSGTGLAECVQFDADSISRVGNLIEFPESLLVNGVVDPLGGRIFAIDAEEGRLLAAKFPGTPGQEVEVVADSTHPLVGSLLSLSRGLTLTTREDIPNGCVLADFSPMRGEWAIWHNGLEWSVTAVQTYHRVESRYWQLYQEDVGPPDIDGTFNIVNASEHPQQAQLFSIDLNIPVGPVFTVPADDSIQWQGLGAVAASEGLQLGSPLELRTAVGGASELKSSRWIEPVSRGGSAAQVGSSPLEIAPLTVLPSLVKRGAAVPVLSHWTNATIVPEGLLGAGVMWVSFTDNGQAPATIDVGGVTTLDPMLSVAFNYQEEWRVPQLGGILDMPDVPSVEGKTVWLQIGLVTSQSDVFVTDFIGTTVWAQSLSATSSSSSMSVSDWCTEQQMQAGLDASAHVQGCLGQ